MKFVLALKKLIKYIFSIPSAPSSHQIGPMLPEYFCIALFDKVKVKNN